MTASWERRLQRAEELAQRWPFATEALKFYAHVARFQASLQDALRGSVPVLACKEEGFVLRSASPLDHRLLLRPKFAGFLELVREIAPPQLAAAADALRSTPEELWEALWDGYWRGQALPDLEVEGPLLAFFPKAFLQPYAALLAAGLRGDGEGDALSSPGVETSPVCPLCGAAPQVSVLREEGHGAARSLLCSRCETEWRYKRVRCVACGEEEARRLVYLQATEWPHVRVSACQVCRRYIKEVDLTRDGLAVPVVDEIAAIPLDLAAGEEGYEKVEPNLIGL
ncbi:MAG: formate dehydrogenase accessory protein FdhE [Armatimonadota bacterium]|nr:formate dehydrogenase accessory protein FdhE [Armatimonadota bacterium]MDR7447517.1 formate dehydrogenase accessory protein FdhE [Armatimonadota bacterium]